MNKKHIVLLTMIIPALLLIAAGCSDDDDSNAGPPLGQNWTRIEVTNSFSNRSGARAAVHNGKIYLVGGMGADELEDCWSTSDGTNWQQGADVTVVGTEGIRNFAMASHKTKLWIHGGVNGSSGSQQYKWNSSSGNDWGRSDFSSTNYRTDQCMISFQDALWAIAGNQNDGSGYMYITNSVSYSSNGTTWYTMPDAPFAPRTKAGITVHDGRMWIVGGTLTGSTPGSTNDVWCTEDGRNWTCVSANAAFGRRSSFGLVTTGGSMYLVGGNLTSTGAAANDIWKSADGVTWEQVAVSNAFPARFEPSVVAFNGGIYIIAGSQSGVGNTNDIWFTK